MTKPRASAFERQPRDHWLIGLDGGSGLEPCWYGLPTASSHLIARGAAEDQPGEDRVLWFAGPFSRAHAVPAPLLEGAMAVALPPPIAFDIVGERIQAAADRLISLADLTTPSTRSAAFHRARSLIRGPSGMAAAIPGASLRSTGQDVSFAIASRIAELPQPVRVAPLRLRSGWALGAFAAQFRRHVGVTPKAYAGIIRMEAAIRELLDRPLTRLSMLAVRVGYYDQAHFTRDFRARCGMTPSQFAAVAAVKGPPGVPAGPRTGGGHASPCHSAFGRPKTCYVDQNSS